MTTERERIYSRLDEQANTIKSLVTTVAGLTDRVTKLEAGAGDSWLDDEITPPKNGKAKKRKTASPLTDEQRQQVVDAYLHLRELLGDDATTYEIAKRVKGMLGLQHSERSVWGILIANGAPRDGKAACGIARRKEA